MQVTLSLKQTTQLPVEAESLIPENVDGKDEAEIARLPLLVGSQWETVADWFDVALDEAVGETPEEAADEAASERPDVSADLLVKGDLTRFKRLGEGMSSGRMVVEGAVGFHAGARMSGGSLTIHGDAADFLGAHMKGGRIVVHGNAGHYTAASYRGEPRGMKGGTIIVTGNAGQMLGARMRRGLIYVLGDCGDVPGFNMKAGTIVVGGKPGVRVGARMVRGTIILLSEATEMLPTFVQACTYRPPVWGVLHTHLADQGFEPQVGPADDFKLYSGDFNEGGKGEVLVRRT